MYSSTALNKYLFSSTFRVGVVFMGTSGDSMEVKSLGKPERYFHFKKNKNQQTNKNPLFL